MSEMSQEQINRNFVAMNEWMKLERKERDELQDKYNRLATAFARQDQELQQVREQLGRIMAKLFLGGPTAV